VFEHVFEYNPWPCWGGERCLEVRNRRQLMTARSLAPEDAVAVQRFLREIGDGFGAPANLKHQAKAWSVRVRSHMPLEDLQAVIWLLVDVSMHRRIVSSDQEIARYLAGRLEDYRRQ
jgi:hypothetical protein